MNEQVVPKNDANTLQISFRSRAISPYLHTYFAHLQAIQNCTVYLQKYILEIKIAQN